MKTKEDFKLLMEEKTKSKSALLEEEKLKIKSAAIKDRNLNLIKNWFYDTLGDFEIIVPSLNDNIIISDLLSLNNQENVNWSFEIWVYRKCKNIQENFSNSKPYKRLCSIIVLEKEFNIISINRNLKIPQTITSIGLVSEEIYKLIEELV